MQIAHNHIILGKIASLFLLIALTLTGCNDDVFVDIPKISVSSESIGVGESTTIKIEEDIPDIPSMQITYDSGYDGGLIYNGRAKSFSDEFLDIEISIDAADRSLTMKAVRNFYEGGVNVMFSHPDISKGINIYIRQQQTDFRPKSIEYELNSWETATKDMKNIFMVDTMLNDFLEVPFKYRVIPDGLSVDQQGAFYPDNAMTNSLFDSENYRVRTAAFDYNGFPAMTDCEVRYNDPINGNRYFGIPTYALQADSAESANSIVSIPPGKGLAYRIYVISERNLIRYNIPLSNDYGYKLNVTGKLEVIVPLRFEYTYNLFDIK